MLVKEVLFLVSAFVVCHSRVDFGTDWDLDKVVCFEDELKKISTKTKL